MAAVAARVLSSASLASSSAATTHSDRIPAAVSKISLGKQLTILVAIVVIAQDEDNC